MNKNTTQEEYVETTSIEQDLLLSVLQSVQKIDALLKTEIKFFEDGDDDAFFIDKVTFTELTVYLPQQLRILQRAGFFSQEEIQPLLEKIDTFASAVQKRSVDENREINQAAVSSQDFEESIEDQKFPEGRFHEKLLGSEPAFAPFFSIIHTYNEQIDKILKKFSKRYDKHARTNITYSTFNKYGFRFSQIYAVPELVPWRYCEEPYIHILALNRQLFKDLKEELQRLRSTYESYKSQYKDSNDLYMKEVVLYYFPQVIQELEDFLLAEEKRIRSFREDYNEYVKETYLLNEQEMEGFQKLCAEIGEALTPLLDNAQNRQMQVVPVLDFLEQAFMRALGKDTSKLSLFLQKQLTDDESVQFLQSVFQDVFKELQETYGIFSNVTLSFKTMSNTFDNLIDAGRVEVNDDQLEIFLQKEYCLKKPYTAVTTLMHESVHAVQIALALVNKTAPETLSAKNVRKMHNMIQRTHLLPLNKDWLQFLSENIAQLQTLFPKTKAFFVKYLSMNAGSNGEQTTETALTTQNVQILLKPFMEFMRQSVYYSSPLEVFAYMYQERYEQSFATFLQNGHIIPESLLKNLQSLYNETEQKSIGQIGGSVSFVNELLAAQAEDFQNISFAQIQNMLHHFCENETLAQNKQAFALLQQVFKMYHATHLNEFHGFSMLNELLQMPNLYTIILPDRKYASAKEKEKACLLELGKLASGLFYVDVQQTTNFERAYAKNDEYDAYPVETVMADVQHLDSYNLCWLITRALQLSCFDKMENSAPLFVKKNGKVQLMSFYDIAYRHIPAEEWAKFFDEQLSVFQTEQSAHSVFGNVDEEKVSLIIEDALFAKYFATHEDGYFEDVKNVHTFEEMKEALHNVLTFVTFMGRHVKLFYPDAVSSMAFHTLMRYIKSEMYYLHDEQRVELQAMIDEIKKQEENNVCIFSGEDVSQYGR